VAANKPANKPANKHGADEGITESVAKLARMLLPGEGFPEILATVTALACTAVPGCEGASVSLVAEPPEEQITTFAPTDSWTKQLDDLQLTLNEGPCLHAVRSGTVVQVDDFGSDGRWERFAAPALEQGLVSSLSVPLTVANENIGGINLYSRQRAGYSDRSVEAGQRLAVQAAVLVANARAYERATRLIDQMQAAMHSRAEIEQAKGILMAESHISPDQAFEVLRRASQRRNVKLRDIANEIVAKASRGPSRRGDESASRRGDEGAPG
jgi:GAF domain-containing protein